MSEPSTPIIAPKRGPGRPRGSTAEQQRQMRVERLAAAGHPQRTLQTIKDMGAQRRAMVDGLGQAESAVSRVRAALKADAALTELELTTSDEDIKAALTEARLANYRALRKLLPTLPSLDPSP